MVSNFLRTLDIQRNAIARYALDDDSSYFVADTDIHSRVISFYGMEGEPVQDQQGDFPEYALNTSREDCLACSVFGKSVDLVQQAVLIPLRYGARRDACFLVFSQ